MMQILRRECNQALALNDFIRVVEITDKIAKAEQLMDNEAKLLSLIEKATKADRTDDIPKLVEELQSIRETINGNLEVFKIFVNLLKAHSL